MNFQEPPKKPFSEAQSLMLIPLLECSGIELYFFAFPSWPLLVVCEIDIPWRDRWASAAKVKSKGESSDLEKKVEDTLLSLPN